MYGGIEGRYLEVENNFNNSGWVEGEGGGRHMGGLPLGPFPCMQSAVAVAAGSRMRGTERTVHGPQRSWTEDMVHGMAVVAAVVMLGDW